MQYEINVFKLNPNPKIDFSTLLFSTTTTEKEQFKIALEELRSKFTPPEYKFQILYYPNPLDLEKFTDEEIVRMIP